MMETAQKLMTLAEWMADRFAPDGSDFISGWLVEDGYAWYLEQHLGRTPTITEMRSIGQISVMMDDTF